MNRGNTGKRQHSILYLTLFHFLAFYPFLINNIFRCGIIIFSREKMNNLVTVDDSISCWLFFCSAFDLIWFWDTRVSIKCIHFFLNHQESNQSFIRNRNCYDKSVSTKRIDIIRNEINRITQTNTLKRKTVKLIFYVRFEWSALCSIYHLSIFEMDFQNCSKGLI